MKIFETFKCSGQNSSNSSCQFWNDKSIPIQILYNSSFSWHITPLWILSSYVFYFGLKDFQVLWWKFAVFLMSFSKPQVIFSSNFVSLASFMKDNSSVLFLGQTLNTLHNMNQWNSKLLRLLSPRVKFSETLVIFETTDQFFFKFCINHQDHET